MLGRGIIDTPSHIFQQSSPPILQQFSPISRDGS